MSGFVDIAEIEAPFQSDPKFGFYLGLVIDRNDPQSLGRIKFRIPGMIEESQWSQCMGMFASEQQGIAWVPELGAMVFVFFHQGNTTHPFWIPGPWAITSTGNEVPSESQVDPDIKTIKTKKFKIVFDDTAIGKLSIESLSGDTKITLDDANGTITIESSSDVDVKSGADATLEAVGDVLVKGDTVKVESITGDIELGTGTLKAVVIEDIVTQINLLKFGGFSIDVPLVITPGTNVSTKVKAAL